MEPTHVGCYLKLTFQRSQWVNLIGRERRYSTRRVSSPMSSRPGRSRRSGWRLMALLQLKIFRPDFLPVAVQNGNAPFRSPLRLARVAGIEIQHAADGFAEALVRMAEDHHVRPFAGGAGS